MTTLQTTTPFLRQTIQNPVADSVYTSQTAALWAVTMWTSFLFLIAILYVFSPSFIMFPEEAILNEYARSIWPLSQNSIPPLTDAWSQPGTTLSFPSPPGLPFEVRRYAAIAYSMGIVLFTTLIAAQLGFKGLWLIPLLLVFQPWFFVYGHQSLGVIPLTLALTAGVYCWLRGKGQLAGLCFGLMAIIWQESLPIVILWSLYLFRKQIINYFGDLWQLGFGRNPFREMDYELEWHPEDEDDPTKRKNRKEEQLKRDRNVLSLIWTWLPYIIWTLMYAATNDSLPLLYLLESLLKARPATGGLYSTSLDWRQTRAGILILVLVSAGLVWKLLQVLAGSSNLHGFMKDTRLLLWFELQRIAGWINGSSTPNHDERRRYRRRVRRRLQLQEHILLLANRTSGVKRAHPEHGEAARRLWPIPFFVMLIIYLFLILTAYQGSAPRPAQWIAITPLLALGALFMLQAPKDTAALRSGNLFQRFVWRITGLVGMTGAILGLLMPVAGGYDLLMNPHLVDIRQPSVILNQIAQGAVDEATRIVTEGFARTGGEELNKSGGDTRPYIVTRNPILRHRLLEQASNFRLCPMDISYRAASMNFHPEHFPTETLVVVDTQTGSELSPNDTLNNRTFATLHENNAHWTLINQWYGPAPQVLWLPELQKLLRSLRFRLPIELQNAELAGYQYRLELYQKHSSQPPDPYAQAYIDRYCGEHYENDSTASRNNTPQEIDEVNITLQSQIGDSETLAQSTNGLNLLTDDPKLVFTRRRPDYQAIFSLGRENVLPQYLTNCPIDKLNHMQELPIIDWSQATCRVHVITSSGDICWMIADPDYVQLPLDNDQFIRPIDMDSICITRQEK